MISFLRSFACLFGLVTIAAAGQAESTAPQSSRSQAAIEASWQTDFPAALEQAKTQGRQVLLNFTGSDWCHWCHRLRDEVFQQKSFVEYARSNLLLVELDFPRASSQPEAERQRNQALAKHFGVTGYPTIILVNGDGHELGRTGYMQGGPKTFVRELKRFAAKPAPAPKS